MIVIKKGSNVACLAGLCIVWPLCRSVTWYPHPHVTQPYVLLHTLACLRGTVDTENGMWPCIRTKLQVLPDFLDTFDH